MRTDAFFLVACVLAAAAPLLPAHGRSVSASPEFTWPTQLEGRPLKESALSARELSFTRDFPGSIRRYTAGPREMIVRWTNAPTRRLHPSSDCLAASGYTIAPLPARRDAGNNVWSRFLAVRGSERLVVQERVHDQQGGTWSDVSAWYWATLLGKTRGPWAAITIAEPERTEL